MSPIGHRWRGYVESLRFRYAPPFANWAADLAILRARRSLAGKPPLAVLIDNPVLHHAVTHETAWVNTGEGKWGTETVQNGYAARIAVHPANSRSVSYQHVCYLTGIAHLARRGLVALKRSAELNAETYDQPMGRFGAYGWSDYSLFNGIRMESVDRPTAPWTMGPSYLGLPSSREQQRTRLDRNQDPLYRALVAALGQKSSQDAWHIFTAERYGLFCFLTMDFKLRRAVERLAGREPFTLLRTRVMTPAEFGCHLRIVPLPPHLFSYTDAPFIVRSDLAWPDGKRQPKRPRRPPNRPVEPQAPPRLHGEPKE